MHVTRYPNHVEIANNGSVLRVFSEAGAAGGYMREDGESIVLSPSEWTGFISMVNPGRLPGELNSADAGRLEVLMSEWRRNGSVRTLEDRLRDFFVKRSMSFERTFRAYNPKREPQLGMCAVLNIDFDDETATVSNGFVRTVCDLKVLVLMQGIGRFDHTLWAELSGRERRMWTEISGKKEEDWKGREVFEGDIVDILHADGDDTEKNAVEEVIIYDMRTIPDLSGGSRYWEFKVVGDLFRGRLCDPYKGIKNDALLQPER